MKRIDLAKHQLGCHWIYYKLLSFTLLTGKLNVSHEGKLMLILLLPRFKKTLHLDFCHQGR